MKMIRNIFVIIILLGVLFPSAFAALRLDDVQFDPAIISAGDTVDVIVQYHDVFTGDSELREGNPEYSFKIWIEKDDTLSKNYITIFDQYGKNDGKIIFEGKYYSDIFRLKVSQDAPSGDYGLKLVGQWFKNGIAEDAVQTIPFSMLVKKEGINLDISNIVTIPSEVRPGDNYVKLLANFENVGQKDAKSVEVQLNMPDGISASYTNNNRISIGRLNAGESKESTFFLDIDEELGSGVYDLDYTLNYIDVDDNSYSKTGDFPFLVKKRPNLEVISSEGLIPVGGSGELSLVVKNIGEQSAESVDVRLLLQNSQPFSLDVRSDYIGELKPGEQGVAIFNINVNKDANEKNHSLKVSIRSKGDSDEGDDNIYIYDRRAELKVEGKTPNYLFHIGVAMFVIVALFAILKRLLK